MGTSKMRVAGVASVMAVALFGFAGLGLAGGPFDPAVKTVVETSCDPDCTGTLTVEVSLSKEADPSGNPNVTGLVVYLEQHWPRSVNNNGWMKIEGTDLNPAVVPACCSFDLNSQTGTLVPVTTVPPIDYTGLCGIVDPTANAIRAVAKVAVTNAKNKQEFLGRSVSIPNPCK